MVKLGGLREYSIDAKAFNKFVHARLSPGVLEGLHFANLPKKHVRGSQWSATLLGATFGTLVFHEGHEGSAAEAINQLQGVVFGGQGLSAVGMANPVAAYSSRGLSNGVLKDGRFFRSRRRDV
eukprot:1275942-Alexandrium_andersonii.AAC.1